jgi:hypothetical protein
METLQGEAFFRTFVEWFYHIVCENEIAVRMKLVIRHQIRIMGGDKGLTIQGKEPFANFKGQFEMIEGTKFVNENERSPVHLLDPVIQWFQGLCSGRGDLPFFEATFINVKKLELS